MRRCLRLLPVVLLLPGVACALAQQRSPDVTYRNWDAVESDYFVELGTTFDRSGDVLAD